MARMRKAKTGKRGAAGAARSANGRGAAKSKREAKAKSAPKNVEEYLAGVTEPARGTLQNVREAIREAAPAGAEEIISYGIPAFRHGGVLIWYAAFAEHCSLFPTAAVIAEFREELSDYKISKGTIQFPIDRAMPAELITRIVKARVAKIAGKKRR